MIARGSVARNAWSFSSLDASPDRSVILGVTWSSVGLLLVANSRSRTTDAFGR